MNSVLLFFISIEAWCPDSMHRNAVLCQVCHLITLVTNFVSASSSLAQPEAVPLNKVSE